MAFTSINVTGTFKNPDGSDAAGTITFLLTEQMENGGIIIEPEPIVATLSGTGTISQSLPANDDSGTSPTSTQYIVIEQTSGSRNREYAFTVLSASPGGTMVLPGPADVGAIFDGEGTDQFISYFTPQDLMDWLQIETAPSNPQVIINMQRVCDMACTWAQRYVGRPLCRTTYSERHDGWAGSDIMLKKTPFLDLVLCQEYSSSGGTLVLPEATPTSNQKTNAIQVDRSVSSIRRVFAGYSWPRTFFPGSRNISITYTAGYDPVPPDAWMATAEYASYWYRHTQQTRRTGVRGGSDPDQLDDQNGLWVGVPYRITALLDPFRVIAIG